MLRSAFVIARRDFTATVFSKAFVFFLLGPLFPVLLGAFFGGIGAKVAQEASHPIVAVVASPADFDRLAVARPRMAVAVENAPLIQLQRSEPEANLRAQAMRLASSKDPPILAVLTDPLGTPHLTGGIRNGGSVQKQVGMMVADAVARQETIFIDVTETGRSAATINKQRALTAQAGQFLLFFLTILLAGMLLSQLIEEKSNKVIEVLAAAVPIDAIFLGKLFAMLATSLLGIAVWTSVGTGAIALLVRGGVAELPVPAVGWGTFMALAVIYFTMNYLLLGSVFLSIGAQASTVREVQTLSMPVTMLQVVILGVASLGIGSPNSPEALAVAAFPLSSPLAMLGRAAEQPDLWPHVIGIGWQMLWVGLILHFGAKLFRRNVMKSGGRRRPWLRPAAVGLLTGIGLARRS
jgi:ABC-2 type transport system permease protein